VNTLYIPLVKTSLAELFCPAKEVFHMLTEFIYSDRVYIFGTVAELRERLREHAANYNTVKALLDDLAP